MLTEKFGDFRVRITDPGESAGYCDGLILAGSKPLIEFYYQVDKPPAGYEWHGFLAEFYIHHLFRREYADWMLTGADKPEGGFILPGDIRHQICNWVVAHHPKKATMDLFDDANTPEWVDYIATDQDGSTYGFCCMPGRILDEGYYTWSAPACESIFLGWFNPITWGTVLERKNKDE